MIKLECYKKSIKKDMFQLGKMAAIVILGITLLYGAFVLVTTYREYVTAYNLYITAITGIIILGLVIQVTEKKSEIEKESVLLPIIVIGSFLFFAWLCYCIYHGRESHPADVETLISVVIMFVAIPFARAYALCKDDAESEAEPTEYSG